MRSTLSVVNFTRYRHTSRFKLELTRIRSEKSTERLLLAGGTEHDWGCPQNSLLIGGDEIYVVEEFAYFGYLVTADNNNGCEIRERIISGCRAYYGFHKTVRSSRLRPRINCTIYKSLIRPSYSTGIRLELCSQWIHRPSEFLSDECRGVSLAVCRWMVCG